MTCRFIDASYAKQLGFIIDRRTNDGADRQPEDGVAEGAGAWAVLHPGDASYAKQLGFIIDPCRVRQPSDKGKVERREHDVKHLLVWKGERFATFAALQRCR